MSIIVGADYIMQENGRDWPHLIVKGFFSVISASSSSGFAAIEYEKYGPIVAVVIFLVMIFGSCAGSTSGGAKIDRLVLMLKNVRIELYRVLHPNTVEIIRINGKPVTRDSFAKTVAFLAIYFLIMALCALIFSCNGVPAFDSAFTSMSMISNIGYGYGATGLAGSYADLSGFCKMVCAFEMLVGRLELFTVLVLFSKSFWKI
jgi:trk system potassium uptake protein TrkH